MGGENNEIRKKIPNIFFLEIMKQREIHEIEALKCEEPL